MTRIKICGLFRHEDIDYVNAARPDWCGFVVNFPKSHRSVTPDKARELAARLAPGIIPVGVFVDRPEEEVADLLLDGTISIAQLHGHEDEAYIASLRAAAPGRAIWKAFKIRGEGDLALANESGADMVLLDNGYGTGEAFDWSLAGGIRRPFILAGGLTPENIPEAIRRLNPYGIDVSSGVESGKKKDFSKISAAVEAARKQ